MQTPPTPKQQTLLDYLRRTIDTQGQIPSLRQAATDLGISHTAVVQRLKSLENKGYIKREGRYSRTVYLLNRDQETAGVHRWRELPIIGQITAGLPMYAQQAWDGTVVVDGAVFTGDNLFVLRVRGDSMRDVGILDGDLTICQPRQYAENGEIVVALVHNEEATVKRFFLHADHIELHPENPAYPVLRYGFDEVLIQGKVVGLQRGSNSALWEPHPGTSAKRTAPGKH
ncbi:transcriptional repressor LexA [Desulfosarcina ovata]|uniref:LexA repressor n=1 Tax=Desulfosarcina ovata subsp. ovata TaxID=2752305 RepID=A0A5K8AMY6_9BACT|nr:transcriptional repressor LexA [Desulfosarcina ovata]BBO93230.1 LexA repressor [Desulfosarcina ovata subsp. ovata]